MNDSAIFQGLARAWSTGTPPTAWPMNIWKNMFFDCPVAIAAHFQTFLGRQMQEQMQLMSDISREQSPANVLTKEVAYYQQSALAWNTEMMELAELVQNKILSSTQLPTTEEKAPFPRAA